MGGGGFLQNPVYRCQRVSVLCGLKRKQMLAKNAEIPQHELKQRCTVCSRENIHRKKGHQAKSRSLRRCIIFRMSNIGRVTQPGLPVFGVWSCCACRQQQKKNTNGPFRSFRKFKNWKRSGGFAFFSQVLKISAQDLRRFGSFRPIGLFATGSPSTCIIRAPTSSCSSRHKPVHGHERAKVRATTDSSIGASEKAQHNKRFHL